MAGTEDIMKMKLLIVEDEEHIRKAMAAILKRYVSEIITAENGEDGLNKYKEHKPDIILSDIRMPKKTGLEMIKAIKEIDEEVHTIVMSAYDESRYLMEAINSGVNSYIVKPVEKDKLLSALRHFYKNKLVKDERDRYEKEVGELKDRLNFALIGNRDGIWDWDVSADKVFYSEQWKAMLGFGDEEISDTLEEWDKRIHEEDRDMVYRTLNKHLDGESEFYDCEYRMETKEKIYKWILDRGKVVKRDEESNKPIRVVGTHTDIDEKKKMEEEIKNNKITKDRIYSIIAHDLKGPIGSTERFMEMFIRQYDEFSEEERIEYTNEIWKSLKRVYSLLINLLDWTKTQRVGFEPEKQEFEISEVIENSINLLKKSAENKNITVNCNNSNNSKIEADMKMVETAVRNIISNAIKFSFEGSTIEIESYKMDEKNIIEIIDHGTGIDKNTLGYIFEVTTKKINDGTSGEKGTGLGLMICKEFIEKNNGTIEVVSEFGKGTKVKIIL